MSTRIRAFRAFGTNANLRASLLQFRAGGEGFVTTFVDQAEARLKGMTEDIEGLRFMPFEKFVARCLTQAGAAMLPVANPIQIREALARACRGLPEDSPFYASRNFPGFVRRLAGTMAELRHWRIGVEELETLPKSSDPWLAAKLRSMVEMEKEVRTLLRSAAREFETDRLDRCLDCQIGEPKPRLWVYSGGEFTPQWADWMRWALQQGMEVWLVVDGHPKAPGLFRGAARMLSEVRAAGSDLGTANELTLSLFTDQPSLTPSVNVRIVTAGDALAESEWAIRILGEENQGGMEWNRAAVYVRSIDEYRPLMAFAAERLGAPLRFAHRLSLAQNGFLRFFLQFLEAADADTPRGLRKLAASSYVGSDAETAQRHREAIGLAAGSPEPWESLGTRIDPALESDRWLADALRMNAKRTMLDVGFAEWADELSDLIQSSWLSRALQADSPARSQDVSAAAKLMQTIAHRAELFDPQEEGLPLVEIRQEISNLAMQTDFAVAAAEPPGVNVVTSSYAVGNAEALCVLGMIEGSFPRRRSEDPILSDLERSAFDALRPGRPRLANSRDQAAAERDELVRLAAAAGRELVLMYPQVSDDRDNTRAFYLSEIERAGAGAVRATSVVSLGLTPPLNECYFARDRTLFDALQGSRDWPVSPVTNSAEAAALFQGQPQEGLSPGELRDAARCPFQFAFKRRLGIYAARPESRWWRLRQLPLSVGLASSPDASSATMALRRALESEIESMGPDIEPSDERLLRAGGERLIREWVEREFLAREIWPKTPETRLPNVPLGEGGTAETLPAGDRTVRLRGQIAAVSEMAGYAVGQLYGSRRIDADRGIEQIEDSDLIELGVPLFALAKKKPDVALEVDTVGGDRLLYLLPRRPEVELESRTGQRLRVVDLGDKRAFFDRLKSVLARVAQTIEDGQVRPCPGEHCQVCDYGELCRRAPDWGEEADVFAEWEGEDDDG